MKKITDGRKKRELREYSVLGWAVRVPACLLWYTWFSLMWLVSWLLDKTFRFFEYAWFALVWLVSWLLDKTFRFFEYAWFLLAWLVAWLLDKKKEDVKNWF